MANSVNHTYFKWRPTYRSSEAYFGERYCITIPPCPDIILGMVFPPKKYLGNGVSLDYTTGVVGWLVGVLRHFRHKKAISCLWRVLTRCLCSVVCRLQPWVLQKRMNQSWCRLEGIDSCRPKEKRISLDVHWRHLTNTIEQSKTVTM